MVKHVDFANEAGKERRHSDSDVPTTRTWAKFEADIISAQRAYANVVNKESIVPRSRQLPGQRERWKRTREVRGAYSPTIQSAELVLT